MTRLLLALCLALGTLTMADAAAPAPAPAPKPAPSRAMFLVVDYDRIAEQAKALKGLYAALDDARNRQAAAHNLALDKLEETFAPYRQDKDSIDPKDYDEALKAFNDATAEMQKNLQEVEAELNAAGDAALAKFDAVRQDVEAEIVAEYRVQTLVDASAALYVRKDSGYDVTDEVLRRIDERLPVLELPQPEDKAPAANQDKIGSN